MKVSIVTVCYNSQSTIRDTIESVLSQAYSNIEHVIIDGGSSDNTLKIVKDYHDKVAVIVSEPDDGIYDAMNKGIRLATGDLVCMLNSDDVYVDESSLQQLVECMVTADTDTVFADLVQVDSNDLNYIIRYYDSSRFSPNRLRYGWMPAHPTFMAKRSLYQKWGGYSLDYRIAADYEMMVRLLYRAGASYAHLPSVVVKMRVGGVSTRGFRNSWILNNEIVRACKENGLKTSLLRVSLKTPAKLYEYFRKPKALGKQE